MASPFDVVVEDVELAPFLPNDTANYQATDCKAAEIRASSADVKPNIFQSLTSQQKIAFIISLSLVYFGSFQACYSLYSLQYSLMTDFKLNYSQFSLFQCIWGLSCVVSALFAPVLFRKLNIFSVILLTQIGLLFSQGILIFGCIYLKTVYLMYFSKTIVGFCGGLVTLTVMASTELIFCAENSGDEMWHTLSFMIVFGAYHAGVAMIRICTIPLKERFGNSFLAPLLLPVLCLIVSCIACVWMLHFNASKRRSLSLRHRSAEAEENGKANAFEMESGEVEDGVDVDVDFDFNWPKIKQLSLRCWLMIIARSITMAGSECFLSQMQMPLVRKYGISEDKANFALSIASMMAVVLIPLVSVLRGWFVQYVVVIIAQLLFILSLFFYIFSASACGLWSLFLVFRTNFSRWFSRSCFWSAPRRR